MLLEQENVHSVLIEKPVCWPHFEKPVHTLPAKELAPTGFLLSLDFRDLGHLWVCFK